MIGQLNLTLWAWIESVRGIRRSSIWKPFLLMAAVQALVLLALTQAWRPVVSAVMVPLFHALGAGQTLHYPQLFVVLPSIFSRANLVTDWLVGSFVFAGAFLLIWAAATGTADGGIWSRVRRSYVQLLVLRLPAVLFLVFLYFWLPRILPFDAEQLRGNSLRAFRYGTFVAGVAAEAILIYAPLALLEQKRSLGGAFRTSLSLSARNPLATLLIVLVPNLVQLPMGAALRRSDTVVRSLTPEAVGWLVALGIGVYVLVNYFVIASAVRVFGARANTPEGGRTWS